MTADDTINVHIERAQCDQIDRWRRAHPLQPSRRAAVRAVLKIGLRQLLKQNAAATPAPPAPALANASEQVSASTAPAGSNQARSN